MRGVSRLQSYIENTMKFYSKLLSWRYFKVGVDFGLLYLTYIFLEISGAHILLVKYVLSVAKYVICT